MHGVNRNMKYTTFIILLISLSGLTAEKPDIGYCTESNPGYIEYLLKSDSNGKVSELELICESTKGSFKQVEQSLLNMYLKSKSVKLKPNSKQKASVYIDNLQSKAL